MAVSDAILKRLLTLHPKIIDLDLDRMWRILALLGNPHERLPPVVHVAGTNGKGSTIATLRAIMEAAGLGVHAYTSPHLVKFNERIRLARPGGSDFIPEADLSALLEECETVNAGAPITFFEITTAAAFLAFARNPADYLLLEVGLGGRLDATNVIARPAATAITAIDYDHQQYLGDTLTAIAHEKAGILKRGVSGIVGAQRDEARAEIERVAARVGAPLRIANQDWQSFEQHGRLVYQDEDGLLDLPMPHLGGAHQIDNAGNAIAVLRALGDKRIGAGHIEQGLRSVTWPARMQRLGEGHLTRSLPPNVEVWLDGGHNPSAGRVLAQAFEKLDERLRRPLILIWGMLNSKDADAFIAPFAGLARRVVTLTIPDEENAFTAAALAEVARHHGLTAISAYSLEHAVAQAAFAPPARILICGSLYLAGRVLAAQTGEAMSEVSGAGRR
ncbi:folylpolyglutamate synthase/dihydrofolate synthase family protein [soil metagenome]